MVVRAGLSSATADDDFEGCDTCFKQGLYVVLTSMKVRAGLFRCGQSSPDGITSGSHSLFVVHDVCEDIGIAQECHGFQGGRALLEPLERTHGRFVEQIALPRKEEIVEELQLIP